MKHFSDFILIFVVIAFVGGLYLVLTHQEVSRAQLQPTQEQTGEKPDPNDIGMTSTDSMEPTLPVGGSIITDRKATPKIGDVVEFDCLQPREKGNCGLNYRYRVVHRLTAISPTGCMTIIGDNPKYDWSTVPCYMPGIDIEIIGVVHKL